MNNKLNKLFSLSPKLSLKLSLKLSPKLNLKSSQPLKPKLPLKQPQAPSQPSLALMSLHPRLKWATPYLPGSPLRVNPATWPHFLSIPTACSYPWMPTPPVCPPRWTPYRRFGEVPARPILFCPKPLPIGASGATSKRTGRTPLLRLGLCRLPAFGNNPSG